MKKNGKTMKKSMPKDVITESKFILLATRQTNKWRDELLGQRIVTLFRKLSDQEDSALASQRTMSSQNSGFFYTERGESKVKHV